MTDPLQTLRDEEKTAQQAAVDHVGSDPLRRLSLLDNEMQKNFNPVEVISIVRWIESQLLYTIAGWMTLMTHSGDERWSRRSDSQWLIKSTAAPFRSIGLRGPGKFLPAVTILYL